MDNITQYGRKRPTTDDNHFRIGTDDDWQELTTLANYSFNWECCSKNNQLVYVGYEDGRIGGTSSSYVTTLPWFLPHISSNDLWGLGDQRSGWLNGYVFIIQHNMAQYTVNVTSQSEQKTVVRF